MEAILDMIRDQQAMPDEGALRIIEEMILQLMEDRDEIGGEG